MSTFFVVSGLLAAVGFRVYVSVLLTRELDKNPELFRKYQNTKAFNYC